MGEKQNKTRSITGLINQVRCKLIIKKKEVFKHSRGSDTVVYMKNKSDDDPIIEKSLELCYCAVAPFIYRILYSFFAKNIQVEMSAFMINRRP